MTNLSQKPGARPLLAKRGDVLGRAESIVAALLVAFAMGCADDSALPPGDAASSASATAERSTVAGGTSAMENQSEGEIPVERRTERDVVPGFRVGHWTHADGTTGCTVVLAPKGTVGAVDVRGGAPASRETDLLRPENMVQEVHAAVLSGGSAFGLDASTGVMSALEAQGVGFETRAGLVPIVVAASLYDLGFGGTNSRPDADCGTQAVENTKERFEVGSVGAGAGATVGKLNGFGGAMRGGLGGSAVLSARGDVVVSAVVAVNAVGDVVDPATGEVVAGMQGGGRLLDARRALGSEAPRTGENTTIGVVVTNARLTQAEATKVAQMAHDGMARAIYPSHTPWDGDTLFVLASGTADADTDLLRLGARAADAVADAILDGVRSASPGFGVPTVADLAEAGAGSRSSEESDAP